MAIRNSMALSMLTEKNIRETEKAKLFLVSEGNSDQWRRTLKMPNRFQRRCYQALDNKLQVAVRTGDQAGNESQISNLTRMGSVLIRKHITRWLTDF